MTMYILALPAAEIVRLLRAEIESAHGGPELNTSASMEYLIEEEFEASAYGIENGEEFDLITSVATLSIEPRVESGYWILEAVIERPLGPVRIFEEGGLAFKELSLDEFEAELRQPGRKRTVTRLQVQTPAVREDFARWLADMQARHPRETPGAQANVKTPNEAVGTSFGTPSKLNEPTDVAARKYWVNEVVGVLSNAEALEAAVDELEVCGFDRAAISVLATDPKAIEQLKRFSQTIKEVEDNSRAPRAAFVSSDSRAEGFAALLGVPLYIGGAIGIWAVSAAGGSLALSLAAAIALGSLGVSYGAVLANAIDHDRSEQIGEQLKLGGLALWVNAPTPDAEKRALEALSKMGARDVHVHKMQREWSLKDIPLPLSQADPFLESDSRG